MSRLSRFAPRSVRAKLLLTILPVIALAIGGLTILAVQRVSDAQEAAVYREAAELAGKEANAFDAKASANASLARTLAAIAAGDRARDRDEMIAQLREAFDSNPTIGGAYLAFERDAFDGAD